MSKLSALGSENIINPGNNAFIPYTEENSNKRK